MMIKKTGRILLLLVAGFCLQCTHQQTRGPAGSKTLITDSETEALAEILGGDSPVNAYRHPMKIDFYTNGDKNYLSTTARKALQQALAESLGGEVSEQGLAKLMATNLKTALIENFVKTLRVLKIVNTGLQLDVSFIPEPNSKNEFSAEFASNQLVRLSETGGLSRQWEQLETATMTSTLYNNSALIPAQKGEADYIGGVMTFYLEILDLKPGIVRPLKNGVKGFIRYRRYYRMNQDLVKNLNCESYTLSAKGAGSGVPLFYTVDLYKNFNLKNLIPTEETFEIFPGLLASSSEGRNELMPDTFEKAGKSIPTSYITVEQKKNTAGGLSFSLHKLVYDLRKKSLDGERSQGKTIYYHSSADTPEAEQDFAVANARKTFLKKCGSSLEDLLHLKKIMPRDLL